MDRDEFVGSECPAGDRDVAQRRLPDPDAFPDDDLRVETQWITPLRGVVADIRVKVCTTTEQAERILTNEPLQAGMVVARPTVTSAASLAGRSTSARMRVPAMRPGSADAGRGGTVLAALIEMLEPGIFGGYPGTPPTIRCDPGGATALRRRASERGRGRRDHAHDSSDERPAVPSSRRAPRLRPAGSGASHAVRRDAWAQSGTPRRPATERSSSRSGQWMPSPRPISSQCQRRW
jgi:hypothetical protein